MSTESLQLAESAVHRVADQLIKRYGPQRVVDALSPVLTDERKKRIEQVLDARLCSLVVVLEDLYDPHIGAVALRSVEAFGLCSAYAIEKATQFSASSSFS